MARATNPLLRGLQYFRRGEKRSGGHSELNARDRDWEYAYRQRWQHDKIVRSTHGVNCTGSCSWKVYVKDGIITWESQQTDYPSNSPDSPEYEPRGCPRGASFSWYTYSPIRIKYPYVRGVLMQMYREAKEQHGDPVDAWASVVEDLAKAKRYKTARGKGGLVRASWLEVAEILAAAHVYTIKKYGPDRIIGFSPIPAMSMASYSSGSRFMSLIGGTIPSFYDWYADLPPSSPQIWGDQTDVPESGDWWNASYLMMWGSNVPITRAPDAHFMTEARYRGQKTVVVSPDFSDHTKFADHWLPIQPGTDGALAMAMGHVILKEFYVDRPVPYFQNYAKKYTDLPILVTLREREGARVSDRFLHAADLGEEGENTEWKTIFVDAKTGEPTVPNGSMGFKYGEEGAGRWNLELGDADLVLSLLGVHDELVEVDLPRFDLGITYRTDEAGAQETLEAVRAAGRRGEVRRLDLTQLPAAVDVIDDLADSLGGIDVLVNNAGTGDPTGEFLHLGYEEWRQIIDTNLSGAFLCAQRTARRMVEAGNGGRIINITSVHEHIPRTGASAYCASKGGLGMLSKVMAMELAEYGILVNAIGPGEISTPMTGAENEDPTTIERPNLPLGRPGHAREIATWVAFLASEKSSYATGASFIVDGGLTLMAAELSS